MAIVRWEPYKRALSPFRGFDALRHSVDRLFDDFLSHDSDEMFESRWHPVVDLSENGDNYLVHAEIPGLNKKDVKITLQDNVLTISGEKKLEREEKNKTYHLVERSHGQFTRSFNLPAKVDEKGIKAEFKNGVLEITLPKAPEAKAREIEIKVQ